MRRRRNVIVVIVVNLIPFPFIISVSREIVDGGGRRMSVHQSKVKGSLPANGGGGWSLRRKK
jgi:hypothetical protein